jgi:DEAD/DEAH box helicase domain-containing protein
MPLDCKNLFNLPDNYSEKQLRKIYHTLAMQHHPDKNKGSTEEMTRVNLCYEALSQNATKGSAPGKRLRRTGSFSAFSEYVASLKKWKLVQVVQDRHEPAVKPIYSTLSKPFPAAIQSKISHRLFSHQATGINHLRGGENIIVTTPTASGKSHIYMLPFLEWVLEDPDSTAIFLFPTKALSNDQLGTLDRLAGGTLKINKYDGSVTSTDKKKIRSDLPNALFTNPDEIHHSMLYTQTEWNSFFKNLKLIVLDEVHTYKGVFGSHVANILQRLQFAIRKAGGNPQYVCTSATIARPVEFAKQLTGKEFMLGEKSGAGSSGRTHVMVEPKWEGSIPLITAPRLAVEEAITLSESGHQVIVFANSRKEVDMLAEYTRGILKKSSPAQYEGAKQNETLPVKLKPEQVITGYHAGYSTEDRAKIENDIRSGRIRIVFSTNALELGIDIGSLDVCILLGIPPTSNEIWQRVGRAGRNHTDPSLVLVINNDSPFDRYYFKNSEEFFKTKLYPNRPIIDPANDDLRKLHLQCAYHEGTKESDVLDKANYQAIDKGMDKWWTYSRLNIRGSRSDNFKIIDQRGAEVGEIESNRIFRDLHPGAIYTIGEDTYSFRRLRKKDRIVELEKLLKVDHYTFPTVTSNVEAADIIEEEVVTFGKGQLLVGHGSVEVKNTVESYMVRSLGMGEPDKYKEIKYPQKWTPLKTNATWISVPPGGLEKWKSQSKELYNDTFSALHTIEHLIIRVLVNRGHCDWSDLAGVTLGYLPATKNPAIVLYDNYPGGLGIATIVFNELEAILSEVSMILANCPCEDGCPACIHTPSHCIEGNRSLDKVAAKAFLDSLSKNKPARSKYSRAKADDSDFPPVERGQYHVGDKYAEGWLVQELEEDGIIIRSQDGELKLIPFEDTPL